MLHINRNIGEAVYLSDAETGQVIASVVLEEVIDTRKIKLGIQAPQTIRINRDLRHGVKNGNHSN